MQNEITESKIYRSLSKIEHPDLPGQNLIGERLKIIEIKSWRASPIMYLLFYQ